MTQIKHIVDTEKMTSRIELDPPLQITGYYYKVVTENNRQYLETYIVTKEGTHYTGIYAIRNKGERSEVAYPTGTTSQVWMLLAYAANLIPSSKGHIRGKHQYTYTLKDRSKGVTNGNIIVLKRGTNEIVGEC